MSLRVLAITFFDPASVVLSHRDLMRAAGHDFRLASVRAYTERQRGADWLCEQLSTSNVSADGSVKELRFESLSPNLESLREFAKSCDMVQMHLGIGTGAGDWASQQNSPMRIAAEIAEVIQRFGLSGIPTKTRVAFTHGSNSTRRNLKSYHDLLRSLGMKFAASTIDYACDLNAAYLPPLVSVPMVGGAPLLARLRGDDDPLVIAHTPTDRIACSTQELQDAARSVGAIILLGEGLRHVDALALKAQAFVGFDHLRGAFSTNTLENAALGLVPLFALKPEYAARMTDEEEIDHPTGHHLGATVESLRDVLRFLTDHPETTRDYQQLAARWWSRHFSAEPITRRLVRFYEGL